ncbi:TPA: hypothetical protein ACT4G1_005352, partial [Escherichia coli]
YKNNKNNIQKKLNNKEKQIISGILIERAITEQKTLTIYSKPNNNSANQVSWQHTELPCFCLLCPYNTGIYFILYCNISIHAPHSIYL